MKKYIILLIASALFSSCGGLLEIFDDELNLKKESFNGTQLRLDGFYYHEIKYPQGDLLYDFYYLYKDGTLYTIGASKDFNYYKKNFNGGIMQKENDTWGVFQIIEDSIKYERWYPAEVSKSYIKEGTILNDTTFLITKSYRLRNGKKKELETVNDIYHFKQYSPKPDSTNRFVK